MTRDDIRLLYEYYCWANLRVSKAASTLSDELSTLSDERQLCLPVDMLSAHVGRRVDWLSLISSSRPIARITIRLESET